MEKDYLIDGAMFKEKEEHDVRDFVASNVGLLISNEQPPASIYLTEYMKETVYQGCVPSCTASSLVNIIASLNSRERKASVTVDQIDQRENNQGRKFECSGDGDYLENALKGLKKNGVKGTDKDGKEYRYYVDGYAYSLFPDTADAIKHELKNLLGVKKIPLYTAFIGNSKIYGQCSAGEVTDIVTKETATGAHAVAIMGYDDTYIYFMNSWKKNFGDDNKFSVFKMSWDLFCQSIPKGMRGWRYWVVYDKQDLPDESIYDDYAPKKDTEEYLAAKFVKENGIINGVNNKLLPNSYATREEMMLMLYRIHKLMCDESNCVSECCKSS